MQLLENKHLGDEVMFSTVSLVQMAFYRKACVCLSNRFLNMGEWLSYIKCLSPAAVESNNIHMVCLKVLQAMLRSHLHLRSADVIYTAPEWARGKSRGTKSKLLVLRLVIRAS